MGFKRWWEEKSGKSKTLTVLSALLILQIGLCFATPTIQPWLYDLLHVRSSQELEELGWMFVEAIACLATVLILALIAIFWHPDLTSSKKKRENHDR